MTEIPTPISAAYPSSYWREPDRTDATLRRWVFRLEELYRAWALGGQDRFIKFVSPGSSILEIGGGDGGWAQRMIGKGYRVCVLEADPRAAAIARSKGVDEVYEGLADQGWENRSIDWSRLDAIVGFHVLEHMEDPSRFLRDTAQRAKSGTTLVLQTPNIDSWQAKLTGKRWIGLDIPRHLNHFTPHTTERMLKANGWTPVVWRQYSRRDSAPGLASSLALWLNPARPTAQPVGAARRLAKGALFWCLCMALKPICWMEAIMGRGGVMTSISIRSDEA